MNILMCRPGKGFGGAEVHNLYLLEAFKKYAPQTNFIYFVTSKIFATELKKRGAKAITLNVFDQEIGIKKDLLRFLPHIPKYFYVYLTTIINYSKKYKLDYVIFQSMTEKLFLTLPLFLFGIKICWLEHGPVFAFDRTQLVKTAYRLNSRFVSKIFPVSQDASNDLIKHGINPRKVITIYPGIDYKRFKPLTIIQKNRIKNKLGISGKKVIGFIGAACEEKGIYEFTKIAQLTQKEHSNIVFLVVGDGNLANKPKNVITVGHKKDVKPYLGIFDLFLFPTKHLEGLSLAITEAFAMRVPVIARNIGGNCELVSDNTGYLFKHENTSVLQKIILRFLYNSPKLDKLGRNGRKLIIERFNYKTWTNNYLKSL